MNAGETERIVRLLSTYQEQLYRYVFALVPHEQDAKDVVQETCVALCRKFEEYDESRPFLPWAYRFAHFEVLKHRQKNRQRALAMSDDVIELLAKDRGSQTELLDARLQALEACLRDLPKSDFELIQGRYQSRLTVEKLAAHLDMSHRTLFRNLKRIRRLLFDCISRRVATEGTA